MKKNSIWIDKKVKTNKKKLKGNVEADVLIIGGGITGISTAYQLIGSGLKVILVEKNKIGLGVTSKTTAKITYLQKNIYSKLEKHYNVSTSKLYLQSQLEGIKIITNIIKQNKIECNLEQVDSYIFACNKKEKEKILKEKEILNKFNINYDVVDKIKEIKDCKYAIKVTDSYVFNPIKYLSKLKEIVVQNGVSIYEDTKVDNIKKYTDFYISKANGYQIKSKYIVLALHYPYFVFPFMMPFRVTLEKSYIEATKILKNFKYSAINVGKPIKSVRYYTDSDSTYKIELTNTHNIAVKNNEKDNFKTIANCKDNYVWSNIDIITNDDLPFIGRINGNMLIGTGYNAWGMTNATIASKIISDIITNKPNLYIKLFNPKRKINIRKIPIIFCSNIYSFLKSKISLQKKWYKKNIKFEIRNNKKVAIYKDNNNVEHIVYPVCPHLKCNLVFNEVELTWDCPCHGSRFNIDGKSIEGPANYNISYKK